MSDEKILVGQINGIYGVKGWVKVFSHTDPRGNILSYSPWFLKIDGQWQTFELENGQLQQGGKAVVAQLKGINDRDVARSYMGVEIAINADQLVETDEFYWRDLIGCEVINQDNLVLGKVSELVETGAHDVLRVGEIDSEDSILIPYVFEEFIVDIDIDNKRIEVYWELEEE